MGMRYVRFRLVHEFKRRTGMLKRNFPVTPAAREFITLQQWRDLKVSFFFNDKASLHFPRQGSIKLKEWFDNYQNGTFLFFGSTPFNLGNDYDWITNPDTGYVYDSRKHWTEISDYSKESGDIKYVWEKSRFSFLYNIIRYDYHFNEDCCEIVFKEILHWIDHNSINCGPNYRCSQEISLRLLNWTFALYYYKNHPALTEEIFQKIMHNIYWQAKHVDNNINFSRIAVRNNHAITETMGLYLFGVLFPFFPEAGKWKRNGKRWFEQEIAYQVYPDGTYLQFSMNYHRVVLQLLTWGIRLSELNNEILNPVVKERASGSLHFLFNCMDLETGRLPNYGANDGALFFPLNDREFRDYRPQLSALSSLLQEGIIEENNEDAYWYGISQKETHLLSQAQGALSYSAGGYYLLREKDSFSFIRCGNHKDRPSQADNLHLDISINGRDILNDGGSYKYNADPETLRYFFGSASHNTVMLGDHDQMQKAERFIWYYWTQSIAAGWLEHEDYYEFRGAIKAFQHVHPEIVHQRTVKKYKGQWKWQVTDEVAHDTCLPLHQLWHPVLTNDLRVSFASSDSNRRPLQEKITTGWYSPEYGIKKENKMLVFSTGTKKIITTIEMAAVNSKT